MSCIVCRKSYRRHLTHPVPHVYMGFVTDREIREAIAWATEILQSRTAESPNRVAG